MLEIIEVLLKLIFVSVWIVFSMSIIILLGQPLIFLVPYFRLIRKKFISPRLGNNISRILSYGTFYLMMLIFLIIFAYFFYYIAIGKVSTIIWDLDIFLN